MKISDKNLTADRTYAMDWSLRLTNAALVFFLFFLFFLPLYEAPKNIFSVLFVFLSGLVCFYRENAVDRLKSMDLVGWAFLLLAISPFVSGVGSPDMDFPDRVSSALNWALMPLVALVFLSVRFSESQLVWALRVFCVGTVFAVVEAFYSWSGEYPELNSVGHVNQSALYLAFCIIPAGFLFIKRSHVADLFLVFAVILSVFWYQGPARSMVGFGASLMLLSGLWVIYCFNRKHYKMLIGSVTLGVISVASAVSLPPQYFGSCQGFKREFDARLNSQNDPYSQRDRLVNTALEVAGRSLTGFGLGSFGAAAKTSKIKESVEARGGDWAAERGFYFSSSHGHNLFANVLVERGWVGIALFSVFLLALLITFSRNLRRVSSQVGVLTLAVICIAGLGQSTLHVEHGQLAFICLALCLANSEEKSKQNI